MKRVKIIVHCLVRDEERFIWYALQSVLPYVDNIMVWDDGSTDRTAEIIKSFNSKKISFKEIGAVDAYGLTSARQKMIDETPSEYDWLMYLDGDEIWTTKYIKTATDFVRSHPDYDTVVVRSHNLVGDIYHRLPESAGQYHIAGMKGHLNLRFINLRRIKGLHVEKPHGQQTYLDSDNVKIQDRDPNRQKFLDIYFHHTTHLIRSDSRATDLKVPKRRQKLKYELGQKIPTSDIPEVFFTDRPINVPDQTGRASIGFWILATLETPLRLFKRKFFPSNVGY